mmetsp:Transcript_67818/g.153465  ORF Transcript_67818/g.153465 Transcript_67818/m.153465 type:complete len:219 (-) Transcript_67818:200-856(-)
MDRAITKVDDGCREKVCIPLLNKAGIERPRTIITYLFLFSSLLVLIAFIIGCVVAADLVGEFSQGANGVEPGYESALQFAAVFSTLLYVCLTAVGIVTLRWYKAPLTIGAFIGCIFVSANLCLILCAMFANIADVMDDDGKDSPYEAFATFQFFLFAVYTGFGIALSVFRNELVEFPDLSVDEDGRPIGTVQGGLGGQGDGSGGGYSASDDLPLSHQS